MDGAPNDTWYFSLYLLVKSIECSLYDPKYEIATKIMDLLMNSDLRSIIKEEEEDNIRSDLGMNDYLYDSEEEQQWDI
ncbi:hypothetical protein QVD99_006056 [Batrachochytrium dendrobatidis]|nr:hypothetical protein QVD99_006056 [Batrachochytrium dendrobatidis]